MSRYLFPLGAFALLVLLLSVGLGKDPRQVPSPLVGRVAPAFSVPELKAVGEQVSPADMRGRVWLLNVWASWCVSCREEHALLLELAKDVPIIGLNYKDQRVDARRWLEQAGDPYLRSAYDGDGRVGIEYGVYGVPETYLIDANGFVHYKQVGPMTRQVWEEKMRPLLKEMRK